CKICGVAAQLSRVASEQSPVARLRLALFRSHLSTEVGTRASLPDLASMFET
uniref:DNA repair protein RecO n=1 Tax=Mesocestoides corti TaxID=53468 RepID=A0A5K3FR17_MESCO